MMGKTGTKWSVKQPNVRALNPFCFVHADLLRFSADMKKLENGKGHRSDDDDPPRRKKPAQKNGKGFGSKGKR